MKWKTFLDSTDRTSHSDWYPDRVKPLTHHAAIGICGESGEILDAVKRALFYNLPLDLVNLREELGDLMWYAARLCRSEGWHLEEILEENQSKLRERYPEKFTTQDAVERKDKK